MDDTVTAKEYFPERNIFQAPISGGTHMCDATPWSLCAPPGSPESPVTRAAEAQILMEDPPPHAWIRCVLDGANRVLCLGVFGGGASVPPNHLLIVKKLRRSPEEGRRRGGREEVYAKQKAMNEVDAGRHRATPASVRHDDDEPLTPISPLLLLSVSLSP